MPPMIMKGKNILFRIKYALHYPTAEHASEILGLWSNTYYGRLCKINFLWHLMLGNIVKRVLVLKYFFCNSCNTLELIWINLSNIKVYLWSPRASLYSLKIKTHSQSLIIHDIFRGNQSRSRIFFVNKNGSQEPGLF